MQILDFITGKSKLVGLIGNPIEHTASPQLHNTLYSSLNVNYVYLPFKIEADKLKEVVDGLKALGFLGFNVTVPYKREIIKFLDVVSREAVLMGAVNTVKITAEGTFGYNTDAEGFLRSFTEETGIGLEGKKVMLIGAGGAARAVGIKLAVEKASDILIVNRNRDKALELVSLINNNIAKDIDIIWCAVDNAAQGARVALQTNGVTKTKIVCSGAWGAAYKNVSTSGDNYIMYVGVSPEDLVRLTLESAKNYFAGKTSDIPKEQNCRLDTIDYKNFGDFSKYFKK
jgi:shikimate 5-dehydrogenase